MRRNKTIEEIDNHKSAALEKVNNYIAELISGDETKQKRADVLCYWIEDYIRFLSKESDFDPKNCRKYNRGDIVKAHLGYRVGSEEGGLHFCVVLDKDNSFSSPVVTVVPLTSLKKSSDIHKVPKYNVYLGNEIYNSLMLKTKEHLKFAEELNERINSHSLPEEKEELDKRIVQLRKFSNEIMKMKVGSIALTNQVVTISKLRIYDPRKNEDFLSGIKLSNTNLDKIDELILCNYTNIKK